MNVIEPLPDKVVEPYDGYPGDQHSISNAYQTMNDFNAEKNLFTEERMAIVGRTRPGPFIPG